MKKSKYFMFIMVLLILVSFAYSVPTFNIFSGYVFCSNSSNYLNDYTISINASDGVNSFSESLNVDSGQYYFLIDANESYNISFYVEDVFVGIENYSSKWTNFINFTLDSSHNLCSSGDPGGDPSGDAGGDAGGTGSPSNNSINCGNEAIDDSEDCDGTKFGNNSCESLGYDEGTLLCDSNCIFDKSHCINLEEEEEQDNQTQFPTEASNTPLIIIIFLTGLIFVFIISFIIFKKYKEKKIEDISKGINLK